ncbi:MAG: LysR family transcriptional regulator [Chloroflexi bacterium]|nr:LysR family transcriptional regulator [Chloroflexota bacterium]
MSTYDAPPEIANLQRLNAFIEAGECLSYSKAARRLGISQPAVSNHIRKLETLTGAKLFQRTGQRIALTEAGHALLRQAKRVEISVQAMYDFMVGLREEVAGHLIVGASTIWEYILPEIMAGFREAYPRVSMELAVGNSARIVELMLDRRMHLGFTGDDGGREELEAVTVMESDIVIVARLDHPLAERASVAPKELEGQAFVLREADSATAKIARHYLETLGVTPDQVVEFGSHESLKAAVRAGFGLGMVSTAAVQQELANGSLSVVRLDAPPCVRQLYMLTSRHGGEAPVRKAFAGYVVERLRGKGECRRVS